MSNSKLKLVISDSKFIIVNDGIYIWHVESTNTSVWKLTEIMLFYIKTWRY